MIVVLCGLCCAQAVSAGPPLSRDFAMPSGFLNRWSAPSESPRRTGLTGQIAALQNQAQGKRLDLHLPSALVDAERTPSTSFSVSPHLSDPNNVGRYTHMDADLPQSGSEVRMKELARRVRHEGVPLVHLWQNPSSSVSFGLNPRGKPGLWWIQKTH